MQASPEREGRNERRVAYGRVGLASAQIMYKRCAYSCTMRIHRIPVPLVHPLTPGPTARRVIYRLGFQMSSLVDYLSVRAGPAFRIAPCGELRAKGFCRIVQRRWVRVAFVYKMAAYTLTLPKITAARAQERELFHCKERGKANIFGTRK